MLPVLISGGGIAGLTLAIALASHGIASRIFEARRERPREGAGIQLGPNATRILSALDVAGRLAPDAVAPHCIIVNDGKGGGDLARLPLGQWIADRHGAPYWVVQRAALQEALWSAATAHELIQIEMGRGVKAVGDQTDSSEITARFADGSQVTGSILVGADGIRSRVRKFVSPDFDLDYAGVTAARALVPKDRIDSSFAEPATGVWLAPSGHIVHYPVDGGATIAIVAIAACPEPDGGWNVSVEADEVVARFQAMPARVRGLLDAADTWRQWGLLRPRGAVQWQRGRCILIGDAAHPIMPYLAQGGAMAIEDAFELAATIAAADADGATSDMTDELATFGQARQSRVAKVQAASIANGQAYHLGGLAAHARNTALRTLPGSLFMQRYDWIYGYRSDRRTH